MIALVMLFSAIVFATAAWYNPDEEIPLLLMAAACAVSGLASLIW